MRMLSSPLCWSALLLVGAGCSSDDAGSAPLGEVDAGNGGAHSEVDAGNADANSEVDAGNGGANSRLSDDALEELASLGASNYLGKAVIESEVEQGNATRVTFDPESGPICLRGAKFSAFYTDRGSDKTMLLLDGGGACWSALCAASEEVEDMMTSIGPASQNPDNPFNDWNVVFVPYCDGSVFSGANEVTEPDGTTRYHHGRHNLAAGLDLALEHFGDSTKLLVGGFSAGGYGTLSGMVAARLAFPQVDLYVMNDSGPGVQNEASVEAVTQRIDEWDYARFIPPSCTGCEGGYGQQTQMFQWMLDNDATVKAAVLSYYEDSVIGGAFNGLSGPEYKELLLTETGKVHDEHPDRFKRFMLPGTSHVVSGGWGTVTADGVEVSAWMNAMVTGDDDVWRDILAE